jgi:serine/threonine protein kinase
MQDPSDVGDDEPLPLPAGTRLGKYQIVRLLGAGGMGAVYEAVHTEIGKLVAVKTLNAQMASSPGMRSRFLREAQLTARVRHPHIVDVSDMGEASGNAFLVMELLRGEDLAQRLTRTGPMAFVELADIMLAVCSAVSAAHAEGIVHRDLKPQNIFLADAPGRVHPKVLDFGISKLNDPQAASTLTRTGALVGTPYYLAPEQVQNARNTGVASDQYACGVILYECLTAIRPFHADSLFGIFQAIVAGNPASPRIYRPDLPQAMEELVLRAMSATPQGRFPSVRALGRALLELASPRAHVLWEAEFNRAPSDGELARPIERRPATGPGAAATAERSGPLPSSVPTMPEVVTPAGPSGRGSRSGQQRVVRERRPGRAGTTRRARHLLLVLSGLVGAGALALALVATSGDRDDDDQAGAARGAPVPGAAAAERRPAVPGAAPAVEQPEQPPGAPEAPEAPGERAERTDPAVAAPGQPAAAPVSDGAPVPVLDDVRSKEGPLLRPGRRGARQGAKKPEDRRAERDEGQEEEGQREEGQREEGKEDGQMEFGSVPLRGRQIAPNGAPLIE